MVTRDIAQGSILWPVLLDTDISMIWMRRLSAPSVPLNLALVRPRLKYCVQFVPFTTNDLLKCLQGRTTKLVKRLEKKRHMRID